MVNEENLKPKSERLGQVRTGGKAMDKLKIEYLSTDELIPYANNPRNNDEAVDYVVNSINAFGFKNPIVVDKDNIVVCGHTRLKAAKKLGIKEVPCIRADDLTEEQIQAYRLADNKIAEKSSWEFSKLGQELEDLLNVDLGFELTDIGFGQFELTALTGDYEPDGFDDELIDQYAEKEQDYLEKKRVIITYTDETIEPLMKMLGLKEVKKVVYDIKELI